MQSLQGTTVGCACAKHAHNSTTSPSVSKPARQPAAIERADEGHVPARHAPVCTHATTLLCQVLPCSARGLVVALGCCNVCYISYPIISIFLVNTRASSCSMHFMSNSGVDTSKRACTLFTAPPSHLQPPPGAVPARATTGAWRWATTGLRAAPGAWWRARPQARARGRGRGRGRPCPCPRP